MTSLSSDSHPPTTTPVIFIVFNRPTQTRKVFEAIAAAKPQKLLVIADGPRARQGEENLCKQVRAITGEIDWPCEVLRNFSELNLGCRERVISGLNWAFSLVEEAIILEDDCLPNPTFFRFCGELLERYRGDKRVAMISGNNFVADHKHSPFSYYFSQLVHIWGWATWRSAWQMYDQNLSNWGVVKTNSLLKEIFPFDADVNRWSTIFQSMWDGTGPDTWDYQWGYTALVNNLVCLVPNVNLVQNIGFGPEAAHTRDGKPPEAVSKSSPISFPLRHPPYMIPSRSFDQFEQEKSRTAIGPLKTARLMLRRLKNP